MLAVRRTADLAQPLRSFGSKRDLAWVESFSTQSLVERSDILIDESIFMKIFLRGLACACLALSLSVVSSQSNSQSSAFVHPEAAIRDLDVVVAGAAWFTEYQYLSSASLKDQKAMLKLDMYKNNPALWAFYSLKLMLMDEAEDGLSKDYQYKARQYRNYHSTVLCAIQKLEQSDDGTPGAYQKNLYRLVNGLSKPQPQKLINGQLLADLRNGQSGLNSTALFELMAVHQLGQAPTSGTVDMNDNEAFRLNTLTRSLLDGQPRGESFYLKNNLLKTDAQLPEFVLSAFTNLVNTPLPGFSALCLTHPKDCFWQKDGELNLYKVIIASLALSHWPLRGLPTADALLSAVKDLEKTRGCPYCDELKRTKQFIHQLAGDKRHNHGKL